METCAIDDCESPARCKRLCNRHYQQSHRGSWPSVDPLKKPHRSGYENPKGYVYVNFGTGKMLEHRYVMEQILGRRLVQGENVHHRNGVKSDNRPENLELWVTSQPAGQRPEDLVAWANEILRRYGP